MLTQLSLLGEMRQAVVSNSEHLHQGCTRKKEKLHCVPRGFAFLPTQTCAHLLLDIAPGLSVL
uniref:Uncharacterized protein n=1 Tax=Anguilla anguilla TaxID=7936 RepID=A0A0E9XTP3_ANGAN